MGSDKLTSFSFYKRCVVGMVWISCLAMIGVGFVPQCSPVHSTGQLGVASRVCNPRISYSLKQRLALRKAARYHPRNISSTKMVFTGIVEEMGTISSIENIDSVEGGANIVVTAEQSTQGVKEGDSIAVNGVCLTVTNLEKKEFAFGLAPETLRRTNLGDLTQGSPVNLERSLAADGRFGGHVVQGHVDCTGVISNLRDEKDATWYTISLPTQYMKYIVEKGYIAIDGTSLTVCDVFDEQSAFTIMMIPYTKAAVVTALKQVGDKVNIEVDITGKYIERILQTRAITA